MKFFNKGSFEKR